MERRSMSMEAASGSITGWIPYDSPSLDLGGFTERIAAGAFRRSLLDTAEILALWSHDPSKPLARRSNGTLQLTDTDAGLRAEIVPDATTYSQDAVTSVQAGTVKGVSFGFSTREDSWKRVSGAWERTLLDVDLLEISPTAAPAYPASAAAA